MAILLSADSRVLVQGITGQAGSFHAEQCLEYGTRIVAGVVPGKAGQRFRDRVPIFDSALDAVGETGADVSLIFVPAPYAADAILEAADAGIRLIIAITEGIPVHDMLRVKAELARTRARLIGPNTPGVITPGQAKAGIMPGPIHRPGSVGIVSRSGTLTYEAVWQVTCEGLGQSTCFGLGGDPIVGTSFVDALDLFSDDPGTEAVLLIGEIGGTAEEEAAARIAAGFPKPVIAYVAGLGAPPGRRMGHAGAIISGGAGRAEDKISCLESAGVRVERSPTGIGRAVREALSASRPG